MRTNELQALMHAVLDAEATPDQAAELQRQLSASPAARAEFEQLKRLFDDLASLPARHPPEGLVASIQAQLPGVRAASKPDAQLSAVSRVLRESEEDIRIRGDGPVEQQHQPLPPQRSFSMTQPHPPYSAKRKAWIGAGIALVAVAIVVRFGFDSVPKSEDVAGTVVAAQRYRAPQGAADIKLGDQTMAQLMQNDAFVKLIRDPQIQAMARDPGFVAAANLMRQNPELARVMAANPEMAQKALAAPEVARAMEQNAQALLAVKQAAEAAIRLQASPEAQKILASNPQLARYVSWLAEMSKVAPWQFSAERSDAARLVALNADFAERFAKHSAEAEKAMQSSEVERAVRNSAEMQQFMKSNADAARYASQYAEAAQFLAKNQDVAQFAARHVDAARLVLNSPEAAHLLLQSPQAAKVMLANPEASRLLLASPEAGRYLLQNPEAARMALAAEATAAERTTR
jgi:hypothetical protein